MVILIVGGKSWWVSHSADQNAARTENMLAAMNTQNLNTYVEDAKGDQAVLAKLLAAADMDPADAVVVYEDLAENADDLYADMARLMAVGIKAENDMADANALIAELEPMATDSTYRASALELQAFLYAGEDNYEGAIAKLDSILNLPAEDQPVGMTQRIEILKEYYNTRMTEEG